MASERTLKVPVEFYKGAGQEVEHCLRFKSLFYFVVSMIPYPSWMSSFSYHTYSCNIPRRSQQFEGIDNWITSRTVDIHAFAWVMVRGGSPLDHWATPTAGRQANMHPQRGTDLVKDFRSFVMKKVRLLFEEKVWRKAS